MEKRNDVAPFRCLGSTGMRTVEPRQRPEGDPFLLRKMCGRVTEVDIAIDVSASNSPSRAVENDSKRRDSKICNKGEYCQEFANRTKNNTYFVARDNYGGVLVRILCLKNCH